MDFPTVAEMRECMKTVDQLICLLDDRELIEPAAAADVAAETLRDAYQVLDKLDCLWIEQAAARRKVASR